MKSLAAKTWVAPVGGMTIPQLELLSALPLSTLIVRIQDPLEIELSLYEPTCFIGSKAALYWETMGERVPNGACWHLDLDEERRIL